MPQGSGSSALRANRQPSGFGEKAVFQADFLHQPLAAIQLTEAAEHAGIDFVAEAVILHFRVIGQKIAMPWDELIAVQARTAERSASAQIKFHSIALVSN